MQVIFIHHSCFLVEVDDLVLIFDSFGGAHDHDARIQVGMLVEQVDLPVNECAQEVTFPKLDDTVRVLRAGEITTV